MSPSPQPLTGRYAPSPSGDLHLGNLRTALIAWLLARSQGEAFLMRIEDLDPDRTSVDVARRQLEDLSLLGLDWDGEPILQSDRGEAYEAAIETLRGRGLIYECFCSRKEIREAASAPNAPDLPDGFYPGTCRELTAAELAERQAGDKPPALRVRTGAETIGFSDRAHGHSEGITDDFVVRRSDGVHGYNLAVVVDDAAQEIGEVVRGEDLLDSTPRQIWLARELGLPPMPSWVHVPLVFGPDGDRLAKRHGSVSLSDRLRDGEDPGQVLGMLAASIGLAEAGERPSPADLVERFSPGSLPELQPLTLGPAGEAGE